MKALRAYTGGLDRYIEILGPTADEDKAKKPKDKGKSEDQ